MVLLGCEHRCGEPAGVVQATGQGSGAMPRVDAILRLGQPRDVAEHDELAFTHSAAVAHGLPSATSISGRGSTRRREPALAPAPLAGRSAQQVASRR